MWKYAVYTSSLCTYILSQLLNWKGNVVRKIKFDSGHGKSVYDEDNWLDIVNDMKLRGLIDNLFVYSD